MDYNTVRNKLIIPEYGRNIQKMVEYAISVDDRDKRTRIAYLIVNVMGQLSPGFKDTVEFRHKMWDHLYYISEYKLDVDSPFPVPEREYIESKPGRIPYPNKLMKYRHYGNNIKLLIDKAIAHPEGPEKEIFIKSIANHMKKLYLTWNRDSVEDDVIYKNLAEISNNKLKLDEDFKLSNTRDILTFANKPKKKKFIPKLGGGGSNNQHRNKKRFQ